MNVTLNLLNAKDSPFLFISLPANFLIAIQTLKVIIKKIIFYLNNIIKRQFQFDDIYFNASLILRIILFIIIFNHTIQGVENNQNDVKKNLPERETKSKHRQDSIKRIQYDKFDDREYISLTRFRGIVKNINIEWDPLLLTVKITYFKKKVRFLVDSRFYSSNGDVYSLDYAPIYKMNDIYIPRPLVEEIFTELGLSLSFKFEEKNIAVREDVKREAAGSEIDFIVIDPGHGGRDPGAFGISSVMEKKITLELSTFVYTFLKKEFPGVKIFMTRTRDEFVTLEKRSDFANSKLNKENFGLFISLHCNSTLQENVNGYEIFYLSQNPGSEEDRKVMMRENDLVSSGDPDIGRIESYLLNSQILSESKMLARQLNRTLMTGLSGQVSSRGVRKADFRVLRKSLMPAILVEIGYISNAGEVVVLQTDMYKRKLADAISTGIKNFIKFRPKMY